jgi:hypothetical protein
MENLSEDEIEVLRYLLSLNKYKVGIICISKSEICKKLKKSEEDLDRIIKKLSLNNLIDILRFPISKSNAQQLLEQIDDLDYSYISSDLPLEDYVRERKRLEEQLEPMVFKREGLKEPMSPLKFRDLLSLRSDYIREMSILLNSSEDIPNSAFNELKVKLNAEIREVQKTIEDYKKYIWSRIMEEDLELNSLKQVINRSITNQGEVEHEDDISSLNQKLDEVSKRKITHLFLCQEGGIKIKECKDWFPEEFREALEVLEARRDVGELDKKAFEEERNRIINNINKIYGNLSQFYVENVKKKLLNDLERLDKIKELLDEEIYQALINEVQRDLRGIKRHF